MENIEIHNNLLSVKINLKGAELTSIYNKNANIEHVWQADSSIWARHAPILFPIVGKVKGDQYEVEGKTYLLGQHGFARDSVFELEEITKTKVVFKLKSNDKSLKIFPFMFNLFVKYNLKGSKLDICYEVVNIDTKEILFSLGAHPGFAVPFDSKSSFEDYYLEFEKEETSDKLLLSNIGLLSGGIHEKFLNKTNIIPLKYKTFNNDALIFENLDSSFISIKSKKTNVSLKMGIANFPLLGIWTIPDKKAPFICIEPWYGVADSESSTGKFKDKKAINKLGVNDNFEMKFFIEIL
ncbi:MAG: aldose 1-epimerase family protein [Flavobacteriaceae bacterium]|nr:aldose 1-epimerase family protein [Flavobacteriaceae bacterium]